MRQQGTLHLHLSSSTQPTAEERLAQGVLEDRFMGGVCGANTFVHEGRGLNMTLNFFRQSSRQNHRCLQCSPASFFLAARHPADIGTVSYRWCPSTDHVIFDDMVSVPLRASTALQSAVLALRACLSSQAHGTGMS